MCVATSTTFKSHLQSDGVDSSISESDESDGRNCESSENSSKVVNCDFSNYLEKPEKFRTSKVRQSRCPSGFGPPKNWTPRFISASGFGPPGSISASRFLPPSADLDPLTKLSKNITIHNFLVESDNNSESRFLEKFFRKYVFKVGTF